MIIQDELVAKTLNIRSFSEEIEGMVLRKDAETYISAIIKFCDAYGYDEMDVVKFISPALKEKLEKEAIEDGHLKRTSKPMMAFE
jgi:hypothetical protein